MIKLRLQRKGRKKRPFYHIVVADSRSPRDGRIIEQLGRFDNVSEKKELTYDEERVIHWLRIGAQPSNTVRNILQKEGILYKMHLMRWGKSEEEIEAALEEWRSQRTAREAESDLSRKARQKELLKAEEKEYKKLLEEKAAAAAKELEKKKEAEEAKAREAEAETEEPTEAAEEKAVAEEAEKEPEAKTETEEEPVAETEETEKATAEAETEVEPEAETEAETAQAEAETEKEAAAEEATAETEVEEPKSEAKEEAPEEAPKAEAEEEKEEAKTAEAAGTVSTDMNANEAIDHIKNTPLKELKGFVPEDEERVTVQRAWEAKQAD